MNIIGVQLILLFFAIFMVYVLYVHWKKQHIPSKVFVVWLIVWFSFTFFVFFPSILQPLIRDLFIIRVMDLGMIGAFMILTYLTIVNNIQIGIHQKEMEELVRKLAIANHQKRKIKRVR